MARRAPTPFLRAARGEGWRATIAIEGSDILRDRLLALDREVAGAALILALDKGGEVLQGAMASLAPQSESGSRGNPPGFLAEHIGREMTRLGAKKAQIAVAPEAEAWYGRYAELGTSDQAPQPFMRPALDATQDTIVETVADELRTMIERLVASGG